MKSQRIWSQTEKLERLRERQSSQPKSKLYLFFGLWPITQGDGWKKKKKMLQAKNSYTVCTDMEPESKIWMYRHLFTFCNYSSFTWWPMLPPERKRERDSWILLPVNPTWSHQVRRQREGEGKTNSLSSSIQTQKLSACLCQSVYLSVSVSLSHNPAPVNQES